MHRLTQIGVDIFFFLSGIGCYTSINKRTTTEFYKRRLIRILPSYLIIFIGYGIFKCYYEKIPIFDYWWTHSIFTFLIDGQTRHWFVFGVLVTYLLTPIFYKIINTNKFWITFGLIIILSSQVWFSPWPVPDNLYVFNELFIARIPSYMIGMYYGKKLYEGKTIVINKDFYLKLIIGILAMFLNSYFNSINTMSVLHYISIFSSIYITFFLSFIFNKIRILPLEQLGKASLESYLVNEKTTGLLMAYTNIKNINLISFIITFFIAIAINRISNLIVKNN